MPSFSSLSYLVLRRRFFPAAVPSPPVLPRVQSSAAVLFLSSPFSSAARSILKGRDIPSSYNPILDLSDHRRLLPGQAIGLVAAAHANFMRVIVDSAGGAPETPTLFGSDPRVGTELLCVVRALLKKMGRRVLVGDRVLVGSIAWHDRKGVIEDLFKRSSVIIDPTVANVDLLLLLFSLERPKPEPFMLTRFLVEAESSGIPFTLALNKAELVSDQTINSWDVRLRSWGYKPMFCSVESRSGLSALLDIMKGLTTVVVGPSGVGKSSLINCLRSKHISEDDQLFDLAGEVAATRKLWFGDQQVGLISSKSGRGKHTTQHVSLLPLSGGGFVADTPGCNQPSLLKVTKKTLAAYFPEISQILDANEPITCSFGDCLHLGEPGCVVNLEWERYPYYFQLLDEIKVREEFQLRTVGTKREVDVRYKAGEMGTKEVEPRLEPKRHRRVSRRRLNQSILDQDHDNLDNLNVLDLLVDRKRANLGHT
ncbi:hypothetical protein HPP92_023839 [Vanilla planifolia]|uniref:Uncharacterized protein n=1 Tax=Vanilla planifolia TaxID=51239 RepID=A0A835PLB2_VANPL|nr:hypothetical protein HPP92_023839 [Vanilla planifolia]